MGLRIASNTSSLTGQRHLTMTKNALDRSLERLSSGSRINHASDDAAGMAISEALKAQLRGVKQARRNALDGISMLQISEGALNEISNIVIRLRELSVQSASDTIGDVERGFADREFQSLKEEVDRIANGTTYNDSPLLNGRTGIIEFQVGTKNNPLIDRIIYDSAKADATTGSLQIDGETINNKLSAQTSLGMLDSALIRVNSLRADMGAMQNRLQSAINSLAISEENLAAANSRIRDTDMAEEVSEMTKSNILMQSGIAVLSQANNSMGGALKLLG